MDQMFSAGQPRQFHVPAGRRTDRHHTDRNRQNVPDFIELPDGMVWYDRVQRPTRHSIGHFGDGGYQTGHLTLRI